MDRRAVAASVAGTSWIVIACMSSCGPKPPAEGDEAGDGGTTSSESDGHGTAGTVGTESPTGGMTSETETGGGELPIPEACALVRVPGDAHVPLDLRVLGGPRLKVLEPGQPGVPARVMTTQLETSGSSHENYRARSFLLESWPDGVAETAASLTLTRAGHSMSRLVELAAGSRRFAYVWTGDPRGVNVYDTFFSILDVDTWSVGGEVEVESNTNPNYVGLISTASSARLLGTYTTESYDTILKDEVSGFSLGVLAGDGTPVVGATPLTLRTPEPGSDVRTFWAGDRVAVAMGHNGCHADDELCVPHAVVLARPTAPDEQGAAVDGFEVTHVIDGLVGTQYVSAPQISAEFGFTWLTWYEGDDWIAPDEHRTFRGLVLDASGDPIPWPPAAPAPGPIAFMNDTNMASWPTLLVSEFGVTVAYRTLDSTFEVHHHDFEFEPRGEPIVLELDSDAARYPSMAALTDPRSLLLAWIEEVDGASSMRMVRLECNEG